MGPCYSFQPLPDYSTFQRLLHAFFLSLSLYRNTDEGHTSNTDTTRPKEIEEVSSECTDAGVKCTDAEASKGGVAWDGVYFHTVNLDCTGLEALLERRFHHPDFTCA